LVEIDAKPAAPVVLVPASDKIARFHGAERRLEAVVYSAPILPWRVAEPLGIGDGG
jgi:hypothetical protein